jgi:molybdopterin-guanine dinucleotide biosynthesis protein A
MDLDIGYIVLAGGKSKRLGRNKIKEMIGDKTLLDRVITVLSAFNGEITIVTSMNSTIPDTFSYPKVKIVHDLYPDKGMIGGILTGLSLSKHYYNLVIAGDMPFLNAGLLRYIIDITEGNDLVAYRNEMNFEPLHAVYSRNCLPVLEEIMKNNFRIFELLKHVKIRYLSLEELKRYDPENQSFFNVITEADLRIAHKIATGNIAEY